MNWSLESSVSSDSLRRCLLKHFEKYDCRTVKLRIFAPQIHSISFTPLKRDMTYSTHIKDIHSDVIVSDVGDVSAVSVSDGGNVSAVSVSDARDVR